MGWLMVLSFITGYASDFSATATSSCSPLISIFSHSFTNVQSVLWDFGDASTSTLNSPGKIFSTPGFYTIKLTVFLNGGGSSIVTKINYIEVKANPIAGFSFLVGNSDCKLGTKVNFTNTSTPNAVTHFWDFGDGNITNAISPNHYYTQSGNYRVILKTYTADSCRDINVQFINVTVNTYVKANFTVADTVYCKNAGSTLFTSTSQTATKIISQLFYINNQLASSSSASTFNHSFTSAGLYSIKLVVVDSMGCKDSISKQVNIVFFAPLTSADLNLSNTSICLGDSISFSVLNSNRTIRWGFGNGVFANGNNIKYKYLAVGVYDLTVFSSINNLCFDTLILRNYIQVIKNPRPSFVIQSNTSCTFPVLYSINNTIQGFSNQKFYLKNNLNKIIDSSSTSTANFNIATSGNYSIQYIAKFGIGCSFDTSWTLNIPSNLTTAKFVAVPDSGCAPLSVVFNDNSSLKIGDSIVSAKWYFGDPISGALNQSSLFRPTHLYNNLGNYHVSYVIRTKFGCFDSILVSNAVRINSRPKANFVKMDTASCSILPLSFTNLTTDTILGTTYNWIFGAAGKSNLKDPKNVPFKLSALYTITLIANNLGCMDTMEAKDMVYIYPPNAKFSSPNPTACKVSHTVDFVDNSDSAVTWSWTFGDSLSGALNYSNLQNPQHTYTKEGMYTVKLVVMSIYGCYDTIIKTNFVRIGRPTANFVATNLSGCVPLNATFAYTGTAGALFWEFGNGNTSNKNNPTALYNQAGVYSVKVMVTDAVGCRDTFERIDYINVKGLFPVFGNTARVGCAPHTMVFSDSTFKTNPVATYLWNFGDSTIAGNISTVANPTIVYKNGGRFTIKLTVTDSNGCSNNITRTNYVTVNKLGASFSNDTVVCKGSQAKFFASSPVSNSTYKWLFSDGTTDTAANPLKSFANAGFYSVTLIVSAPNACSDTILKTNCIQVIDLKVKLSVSNNIGYCAPFTSQFFDSTANAISWKWSFSDNSFATIQNPLKTFLTNSVFNAKLVVVDKFGCTDSTVRDSIVIVNGPAAKFVINQGSKCAPSIVQFTNISTRYTGSIWDFGNGQISNSQNPNNIYSTPSSYKPILVVYDSLNCRSSYVYPGTIIVDSVPVANYSFANNLFCDTTMVNFLDQSKGAVSWRWNLGDSVIHTQKNPSKQFTKGSYNIRLIVTNNKGCKDTIENSPVLTINPRPKAKFGIVDLIQCIGSPSVFIDSSYSQNGKIISWSWLYGNNLFSTSANPVYLFLNTGKHSVQLKITDSLGCSDTIIKGNLVQIIDSTNLSLDVIKAISVVSDSGIIVNWQATKIDGFSHYKLYKRAFGTLDSFVCVYKTDNILDSFYLDNSSFTQDTSYQYRLRVVNICGSESKVEYSETHQSILLKAKSTNTNKVELSWSNYIGWTPDKYRITRCLKGSNIAKQIAELEGNVLEYLDTEVCNGLYVYKVEAKSNFFQESSFSNTSEALVSFTTLVRQTTVENVSVDNKENIEISFSASTQKNLLRYIIKRSDDGGVLYISNFAYLPPTSVTFNDDKAKTNKQSYFYTISTVDSCGIECQVSLPKRSIYLRYTEKKGKITLTWNEFINYKFGVEYYRVERYNPSSLNWEEIGQTKTLSYIDEPNGNQKEAYKYRVVAIEQNGVYFSNSNTIEVILPPTLFMPNAFTPNNDGVNDVIRAVGTNILEFEMLIYDRWGQEIFRSNELKNGWNGFHKDKKVQQGLYNYLIKAVGVNGSNIYKNGNISVMY